MLPGTTRQVVIVAVADLDFNVGERSAGFAIFCRCDIVGIPNEQYVELGLAPQKEFAVQGR